jgi:hypothetical protein
LFIDDSANINLKLDAPVNVRRAATRSSSSRCACTARWRACAVKGAWSRGGVEPGSRCANLPIKHADRGIHAQGRIPGHRERHGQHIGASGGARSWAAARADLVDAAIRHKLASGRTDVISFGSGFVTLQAEPDHDSASCASMRRARGLIAGACAPNAARRTTMDWPLRGQMQMATGELGSSRCMCPDIDRASGHFDANLSFEGTLGSRAPAASSSSRAPSWIFYQLNLALRALEMEARIVSNNLEFSAEREGRRRQLSSSGQARVARTAQPYGDITLDGENLRSWTCPRRASTRRPISTSASMRTTSSSKGEVKVPLARIRPADLTNAVLPRPTKCWSADRARSRRIRSASPAKSP